MVSIAIALTDYAAASPGLIADSEYRSRVDAHFDEMRGHQLVAELNQRMQGEPILAYIRLKLDAYAFEFDSGGRIVRSSVYDRIDQESQTNSLLPLLAELQSFAVETGFLEFYAANRKLYLTQIAYLRDSTDAPGMWRWLRERFPAVSPYDGVKIVFSPLVGDIQNLVTFDSNGYRELQPHINFPYRVNPNLSAEGNAVWSGTLLFGEMNHGFINPTAERYHAEIDAAIADRDFWTTGANSVAYPDNLSLFNEHMNFGLISLYHHDRINAEDRERDGGGAGIQEIRGVQCIPIESLREPKAQSVSCRPLSGDYCLVCGSAVQLGRIKKRRSRRTAASS